MKKVIFLFAALSVIMLNSCDPKKSKEYIAAQQELDSLKAIIQTRDTEVQSLFETLNEIEDNLNTVSSDFQKVGQMKPDNTETNKDTRAKIGQQINDIKSVLSENKKKLDRVNAQLSSSNKQNKELKQYIAKLDARISEQDAQIQALITDLGKKDQMISNLNTNVESLKKVNEDKDKTISLKTLEANTAYYIVGTKKELKAANLIDKKGGFIGIGSQTILNQNASSDSFSKIDITKVNIIQLPNVKSVKLITTHPENSYEIPKNGEGKYDVININNPAEFWRVSKYLVVVIN